MKKIISLLTVAVLVVTSISGLTVLAQEDKPIVYYNDAVMSGMGLANIYDGDYTTGYVSEDAPDMADGKQYFQFTWEQQVDYNSVTLYSSWCGTANTSGQAPTKWKIQTSVDGATYTDVAKVTAEWLAKDDVQSKTVSLNLTDSYKYMRIVISDAKLDWGHYVVNEVEFATKNTDIGNFLILGDSYSTFEGYIPDGNEAWYQDGGREGTDVTNVEQTWWKIFEHNTNANLMRNESYSGTTICNTGYDGYDASSISFIGRFDKLVANRYFQENTIDTVIIFGGTNDSWAVSPIGQPVYSDWSENDKKEVLPAFSYLLNSIKDNAPEAKIICIINDGLVPQITNGMSEICKKYKVECVKLNGIDKQTQHPSVAGMVQVEEQLRNVLFNKPTVYYNDAVMSGMGLPNVYDGDYTTGYVSEDNPDMTEGKQYFQYTWEQAVDYNSVTLYSSWCGTANTQGQAPTKWKIQTSVDGHTYTDVANVTCEWNEGSEVQSSTVSFTCEENYKYMRVVILDANLDWKHYAVNEIEITTEDINGDINGNEPVVFYNDSAMSGMGLANIYDGDYTTGYVSEDAPDMTDGKQYFQYVWREPVDVNLVTLYSQYCGAEGKAGQAPTKWTILTSTDRTNFEEAATVTANWYANDNLQSKTVKFDAGGSFIAMRIVITEANLDWNHYSIYEIKTDTVDDSYVIEDLTGETPVIPPVNPPVNPPAETTVLVSYNDAVMRGMGLSHLYDGDLSTSYQSEDAPDMADGKQYFQYDWSASVDVNLVTLYSQYCGAGQKDGQAPTEWKILTSTDGVNYKEVTTVSASWYENDDLQSKTVKFDAGESFTSMRIVITEANLDWNHYSIYEIKTDTVDDNYIIQDLTGTIPEQPTLNSYVDANGVTQYGNCAQISYNDKAMSGMGLGFVSDKDKTTAYVSEEKPDMSDGKQYIQYDWTEPIDINMVTLYSQFCGTKLKDGQAPTKWSILVSTDGVNYTKVCDVKKNWRSNDNLQSKVAQFDTQENIISLRIVFNDANLGWGHYAIYEIEVGNAPAGYKGADLTGIGQNIETAPKTGDSQNIFVIFLVFVVSMAYIAVNIWKKETGNTVN